MSDEAPAPEKERESKKEKESASDGATEQKAKSTGRSILVVAGLAGGLLGGVVGGAVLAPRLVSRGAAPTTASAAADGGHAQKSSGEHKDAASEGKIFRLDNVIVNPAGSEGTRFLMTSIAFEVSDDAEENTLKAHELELRDMVLGKLSGMTMSMLTQAGARDSLKIQLADAAATIVGPHASVTVYLPQFVIQ